MSDKKKHTKLKKFLVKCLFKIIDEMALLMFGLFLWIIGSEGIKLCLHYGYAYALVPSIFVYIIMMHLLKKVILLLDIGKLPQISGFVTVKEQGNKKSSNEKLLEKTNLDVMKGALQQTFYKYIDGLNETQFFEFLIDIDKSKLSYKGINIPKEVLDCDHCYGCYGDCGLRIWEWTGDRNLTAECRKRFFRYCKEPAPEGASDKEI